MKIRLKMKLRKLNFDHLKNTNTTLTLYILNWIGNTEFGKGVETQ
jgi:hypothetical protein